MDSFDQVLQGLMQAVQVSRARQDGVAVGEYRCECGQIRRWDDPNRCAICPPRSPDALSAEEKRVLLQPAFRTIPDGMDWCRIGNPKWEEHCARKGKELVKSWRREAGSTVLWGRTGAGKTIAAVALMHRILDHVLRNDVDRQMLRFAAGMRFVSALDLALDRRKHPLGKAEAPLVELAKKASLLVLDEVGYEVFEPGRDTTLFEIANDRFGKSQKPTIMTTGLDFRRDGRPVEGWDRFVSRYGEALWRRFRECGVEIELQKAGAK